MGKRRRKKQKKWLRQIFNSYCQDCQSDECVCFDADKWLDSGASHLEWEGRVCSLCLVPVAQCPHGGAKDARTV